jgi:putative transposase
MKKSRFTEEQIAYALRQAESGTAVADVCRQLGVSEATFYVWKKKVRASRDERDAPPPAARGREQPAEAPRRRSHARQAHARGGAPKKRVTPTRRRATAQWFQDTFGISCVRACRLAGFSRAAWYRKSKARDQSAIRLRIREFAQARPRFGYYRIYVLLRREGWRGEPEARAAPVPARRLAGPPAGPQTAPSVAAPRARGGADGRAATVERGLRARSVGRRPGVSRAHGRRSVESPESFVRGGPAGHRRRRGGGPRPRALYAGTAPRSITVDHGTEFTSMALDTWAFEHRIARDFTRPGQAHRQRAHRIVQRALAR